MRGLSTCLGLLSVSLACAMVPVLAALLVVWPTRVGRWGCECTPALVRAVWYGFALMRVVVVGRPVVGAVDV